MTLQQNFSAANPNFWARLVILALGLFAVAGVQFPASPDVLGDQIVTTITGGGITAVIGILFVSVIMPIYNFFSKKPRLSAAVFFSDPNLYIYVGTFVAGLVALTGIVLPTGTVEAIVNAAFSKDLTALVSIILTNVLDPVLRWLLDKRAKAVTVQMDSASYGKAA